MQELNEDIKIRWAGVARDRIGGWAQDFANAEEDNGLEHYVRAHERQKTNLVIKTVEEAEAVAGFVNKVIDEGGKYGRTWVNASVDKAAERVRNEIVGEMSERGFDVQKLNSVYGLEFVPTQKNVVVNPGDRVKCAGQIYIVELVKDDYVIANDGTALSTNGLEDVTV